MFMLYHSVTCRVEGILWWQARSCTRYSLSQHYMRKHTCETWWSLSTRRPVGLKVVPRLAVCVTGQVENCTIAQFAKKGDGVYAWGGQRAMWQTHSSSAHQQSCFSSSLLMYFTPTRSPDIEVNSQFDDPDTDVSSYQSRIQDQGPVSCWYTSIRFVTGLLIVP